MSSHFLHRPLICAGLTACLAHAQAQSIALDLNVGVSRVGNGSSALTTAAKPVYIDNYKVAVSIDTSGSLPIPVFTTSSPVSLSSGLSASGTDSSQGVLNISGDRRSLLLGGISSTGAPTLSNWTAAGLADGQLDPAQPAANLGANAGSVRGVWSPDGVSYDVATTGPNGVQTASFGSTTAPVLLSGAGQNTDVRQPGGMLAYGQGAAQGSYNLVYSAGSATGGVAGIYQLGSGLPQTPGQPATLLVATQGGATPNGFFFADLSSTVPGLDTLYVATTGGGLQKFSYTPGSGGSGGHWSYTSALTGANVRVANISYWDTLSVAALDGVSAPSLTLPDGQGGTTQTPSFAAAAMTASHHRWSTTATGNVLSDKTTDELDMFVDFSGYEGDMNGGGAIVYALAAGYDSSTIDLRGVAVTPDVTVAVPEPGTPVLLLAGVLGVGARRLRRSD